MATKAAKKESNNLFKLLTAKLLSEDQAGLGPLGTG